MSNFLRPPCDEAQIRSGRHVFARSERVRPWILVVAILGSSMAFIDSTVVNVALPRMQSDFQADMADVQWVVESYALVLAALLLVGGSLGDQLGRKLSFGVGVAIFTGASIWCGLSPDIRWLIAARAVQGLGAALLIPGSLALLSASFSPEERGRAIGTWSGFSGITAAIGPVLGGWFVQHSWRWVFLINVPLGAAVLWILFRCLPETGDASRQHHFDLVGAVLATASLGCLVYGLLAVPAVGWTSAKVMATLALGVAGTVTFVLAERRNAEVMVPLDLFGSPTFTGANVLTLLLYAGLGGALFFVPFDLIQVQGYSPLAAGAALLPFVVIMFLLSRWAGGLVARYGPKRPLIAGPLIAAVGFGLFALPAVGGSYWTTFFPAAAVLGLGMAVSVAPLTTTVMDSVEQGRAGAASGINNAVSRLAGLIAVAAFGLVLQGVFNTQIGERLAAIPAPLPAKAAIKQQRTKLAEITIPQSVEPDSRLQLKHAVDEAFVAGFRRVMLISAALALASAGTAAILISGRIKTSVHRVSLEQPAA